MRVAEVIDDDVDRAVAALGAHGFVYRRFAPYRPPPGGQDAEAAPGDPGQPPDLQVQAVEAGLGTLGDAVVPAVPEPAAMPVVIPEAAVPDMAAWEAQASADEVGDDASGDDASGDVDAMPAPDPQAGDAGPDDAAPPSVPAVAAPFADIPEAAAPDAVADEREAGADVSGEREPGGVDSAPAADPSSPFMAATAAMAPAAPEIAAPDAVADDLEAGADGPADAGSGDRASPPPLTSTPFVLAWTAAEPAGGLVEPDAPVPSAPSTPQFGLSSAFGAPLSAPVPDEPPPPGPLLTASLPALFSAGDDLPEAPFAPPPPSRPGALPPLAVRLAALRRDPPPRSTAPPVNVFQIAWAAAEPDAAVRPPPPGPPEQPPAPSPAALGGLGMFRRP